MGVPTSEVGYTSAIAKRKTTKSIRDMWLHWIKKKTQCVIKSASARLVTEERNMQQQNCWQVKCRKSVVPKTSNKWVLQHLVTVKGTPLHLTYTGS
jgi:hypothetical protein